MQELNKHEIDVVSGGCVVLAPVVSTGICHNTPPSNDCPPAPSYGCQPAPSHGCAPAPVGCH